MAKTVNRRFMDLSGDARHTRAAKVRKMAATVRRKTLSMAPLVWNLMPGSGED
jgi:hypothetical protein